jgi:hypothetical protein
MDYLAIIGCLTSDDCSLSENPVRYRMNDASAGIAVRNLRHHEASPEL